MNILVTGSNGFIGSNLIKSIKGHSIFEGNRNTINLYSKSNIESFLIKNKINVIIHCAIEGGSRLKEDNADVLYKNILMFENLMSFKEHYSTFINISSGAEFDRSKNLMNYSENELFNNTPLDYYGLSKNLISKLVLNFERGLNLRIFGCFGENEINTKFIKSNTINYINKSDMIIHQDKYMDFIYIEDVCNIIQYTIDKRIRGDINLSYMNKLKLTDIANIINTLSTYKASIQTINKEMGLSYTGNGSKLNSLNLNLKGIELGIKECYSKIL